MGMWANRKTRMSGRSNVFLGHSVCMVRPTKRLRRGDVWSPLKEFCGIFWLADCMNTRTPKESGEEREGWPTSMRKWMWSLIFLWLHLFSSGCVHFPSLKTFPEVAVLMASSPKHCARKCLSTCYKQGTGPRANQTSEKNMVESTVATPGCQETLTSSIQSSLTEHLGWTNFMINELVSLLKKIFLIG